MKPGWGGGGGLTKARDEEQVLDAVTDRVGQGQVDEGLDVEVVHQGQPGVVLGLQGVRGQRAWWGGQQSREITLTAPHKCFRILWK